MVFLENMADNSEMFVEQIDGIFVTFDGNLSFLMIICHFGWYIS